MVMYAIKRVPRSRSIKVRVEASGEVVVTAPKLVPKFIIERFVKVNEGWIERHMSKLALTKTAFPVFEWEQKLVSYLGKLYTIRITIQDLRFKINNNEIIISPVTGLPADAKKMLVTWLKREGEREIAERTVKWSEKMGVNYRGIRFRQQKSRWGSCTHQNHLSFNWRLIHFKPEIIDYVVIHELSHTKHHNHGSEFWELVDQFDPSYKQKVKFLRRQSLVLI